MDIKWFVGIDEAGRGSLAGPLSFGAVAVRLDDLSALSGVKDSKRMAPRVRENWHERLVSNDKVHTLYGEVGQDKIDKYRMGKVIPYGSRAIAKRMFNKLGADENKVLVLLDGSLEAPYWMRQMTIIDGDDMVSVISAASVIAKVRRDRAMRTLHCRYPKYGFNRHKGYGTKVHREAIRQHGPSEIHRKSFTLL